MSSPSLEKARFVSLSIFWSYSEDVSNYLGCVGEAQIRDQTEMVAERFKTGEIKYKEYTEDSGQN